MSTEKKLPHEEDPRETPSDDPRQKTDWPNTKQTDEPWNGFPEKEQRNDTDIDLEKWQESILIGLRRVERRLPEAVSCGPLSVS
jgi:hypothetical protein